MRQSIPAFLLGAVAAVGLCGPAHADAVSAAPDFVLKAADGRNYRLSEYRGRVVAIAFHASWCGECRSQLGALASLGGLPDDLELLAVGVDRDRDRNADAARTVGATFPFLHDAAGDVSERYAADRLPMLVLVDRDGVVRHRHVGFDRGDEHSYLEQARRLLDE